MKKLIYILTVGILVSLVSCGPVRNKELVDGDPNHTDMFIDTIGIHGVRHEIIVRELFEGNRGYGGIMHSPECWCFKNDRINKSTNPTTENVENSISESQYGASY